MYAQQAMGQSMSPQTHGSTLPGVLRPTTLPPLSDSRIPLNRRISELAPPPLPNILGPNKGPMHRPFINKVSPITSSDENVTSTSDVDTEGATTSDGGGLPPLQISPTSLRPVLPPIQSFRRPEIPRHLTTGGLSQLGTVPTMPSRRVSVDPFATTSPPLSPTSPIGSPRSLPTPLNFRRPRALSVGVLPGLSVRPPQLPQISKTDNMPTLTTVPDSTTKGNSLDGSQSNTNT